MANKFLLAMIAAVVTLPPQNGALPSVWVIGDSTASNVQRRGWGDYFDAAHPDPVDRFDVPAEPRQKAETPYGK